MPAILFLYQTGKKVAKLPTLDLNNVLATLLNFRATLKKIRFKIFFSQHVATLITKDDIGFLAKSLSLKNSDNSFKWITCLRLPKSLNDVQSPSRQGAKKSCLVAVTRVLKKNSVDILLADESEE